MDVTLKDLRELLCCREGGLPFDVGQTYLFRTIGYHWLGKVKEVQGKFLVLDPAGWVANTGRYHEACAKGIDSIPAAEFEPCGRAAILNTDHVTDAVTYPFHLPGGVK